MATLTLQQLERHLHEPHHTPEFWRRVERALPDFERRKRWLAEHAADYVEF